MPAFVLMGSGEFTPWAEEADRWALDNATISSDRVLVVPAASAPEGDEVFDNWARMGIAYFSGFGVRPELLDIRSRGDADDPAIARRAEGARYIFFSGGNPSVLADTLRGTATWKAIREAVAAGAALGGCSAGMVALGVSAPDAANGGPSSDGLRLFTKGYFGAHWNMLDQWVPGLTRRILEAWPKDAILFACDEDTAACGDGTQWHVVGSGGLTIPSEEGLERLVAGTDVTVPLGLDLGA
ncbi:MAG: Type 1 glutamine amidotransferase-like domain-containing protein [Actinomycetota bacterium]|nr:Type 1 glutamine amidotransferase-like domain-containing protein [Actinomycetota bacterium]